MKIFPKLNELQNHIHHYWIVKESNKLFSASNRVYGYPGIRPEIIIILKGYLTYTYLGKTYKTNKSLLASHIDGNFLFDSHNLEQFIIVQFEPRSISSLLPFTKYSSRQLKQNSLCNFEDVFQHVDKLERTLLEQDSSTSGDILDEFFHKTLNDNFNGFLIDLLLDLPFDAGIPLILEKTGYSLSTLERRVKNETGLTPKAFLSLKKYKSAVEEIHLNKNIDWQYYINKYNYFDQSHFIKTIKGFTSFTPTQLVGNANLISIRPEYY